MKDLAETVISYALALAALIAVYTLMGAQLSGLITQAFAQVK